MSTTPVGGLVPRATDGAADLIVRNARIHTGDPARPQAEALAHTKVVDALGRRTVPGLNDAHLHVIRGGLNYVLELRWDGVPDAAPGAGHAA